MDGGLDDRTLRRIIAMLVALAALAERAANRSFPVRWFVLSLLRYAERVARDVLVEETGWDWSDIDDAFGIGGDPDDPLGLGSGPADALALAWRLRALAALFRALLSPDDLFGRGEARTVAALIRHVARPALVPLAPFGRVHPAPDTS